MQTTHPISGQTTESVLGRRPEMHIRTRYWKKLLTNWELPRSDLLVPSGDLSFWTLRHFRCVHDAQPILPEDFRGCLAFPQCFDELGIAARIKTLQRAFTVGQVQADRDVCRACNLQPVHDVICPFVYRWHERFGIRCIPPRLSVELTREPSHPCIKCVYVRSIIAFRRPD